MTIPTLAFSAGDPCWLELMTDSMERSADFYGALFGWEFHDVGADFGHYHTITSGGAAIGGAMQTPDAAVGMPGAPVGSPDGAWTVYLHTPDIHGLAERARDAGAEVLFGPMQVGPFGWAATVRHPALGEVAAWQPLELAGLGRIGGTGLPAWFELHTPRFGAALRLLSDVFQWEVSVEADTPAFRYAQQHAGERGRAGVFDLSAEPGALPGIDAERPAQWFVYVAVPDVRKAASAAAELGGAIVEEAQDTPYGILAGIADPEGARLKLSEPRS
ncbi:VOC family protein [Schaalia naturae]|uniref:VOC family protein n=1 Tax=Schaalia naturae TaxID=635203 RepID=A0ABW2SMW4_9ACTO